MFLPGLVGFWVVERKAQRLPGNRGRGRNQSNRTKRNSERKAPPAVRWSEKLGVVLTDYL